MKAVFLDMDGVLVDGDRLPFEYQRLLGEVLAPELGGAVEDWSRANAIAFPIWSAATRALPPDESPLERYDRESVLSIRGMCEVLGFPPPSRDACIQLGRAGDIYVRTHHEAFYPEATQVIRELASRYTVHFATGNPSWTVRVTMERLGVADCIALPCGPDLVGVLKQSPRFYGLLFRLADVRPADAVVVDDTDAQLLQAAQLGARTVLINRQGDSSSHANAVIPGIGQLPQTLAALTR